MVVKPLTRDKMNLMESIQTPWCGKYQRTVELIGRRWTGAILRALFSGVSRFSDLCGTVPGLSDRMLAERLKELEVEGIVQRTVIPDTPVRVEYSLTEKGRELEAVIVAVSGWAERWDHSPVAAEASH
jgi:DNA-binding HxlR family transcriptional regulator